MNDSSSKMTTVEGAAIEEQKIIKKLREQQNCKQQAVKSQKTLHKCLSRILRKSSAQHQRLVEVQDEVSWNFSNYFLLRN